MRTVEISGFDEHEVLHELKHYLPAQAPLKDFIHHNTLHAFQNLKFDDATRTAAKMFGYNVSLSLEEYRNLFEQKRIKIENLERIITDKKGKESLSVWMDRLLKKDYDTSNSPRIGALRDHWKSQYHVNLDSITHPKIFRILCSYLDQGISIWKFPVHKKGFLTSIREIERNSSSSIFMTARIRELFLNTRFEIEDLLTVLVGDKALYKQYIFDQQFAHQGWSGMVSSIEDQPETLLDPKKISVKELIILECLLEMDVLENKFGENWAPLTFKLKDDLIDLFAPVPLEELSEVLFIWQNAFEWTYYDSVLTGLQQIKKEGESNPSKSFQAMFCIDDRECSIRRYIEDTDVNCETFGTPGFFGVEFYFKPEHGKFYSKLCPAPVTPKFLIKEIDTSTKRKKDAHFTSQSHSLFRGWLISQTLGFWSAMRLFLNIFKPTMSPATASSFNHMGKFSKLTIENTGPDDKENELQIGFTLEEMVSRVEALLRSIGLIKNFAPIVYVVGHGSSSVNNPHYAGYDCGACSGRPGSVNARVVCYMANKKEVRERLAQKGISIPSTTQFLGGLHDTSRDDISFYDEDSLSASNKELHAKNEKTFIQALDLNAKERSRRLMSIDTTLSPEKIHDKVRTRSVSIFEPRPELNHATNALCIVGGREFSKGLFLDRRSFMNSYDYKTDPEGIILTNIMKPLGPVCGGINLEYYFSRVDNQKLGAGTKLPHNVMGLFGVANGIDGDLRPGLPSQMIEVHDPIRLLIIVEHFPEVVLQVIQSVEAMYEWFKNEWINLVAVDPETKQLHVFKDGKFKPYVPVDQTIETVNDITPILESTIDNIPVLILSHKLFIMQTLIQFFIILPLIGFIINALLPKKNENLISKTAIYTVGIHFVSFVAFVIYWLFNGHQTFDFKTLVLFQSTGYEFFIDFCFDKITVVYMLVGSFLTFLVTIYCNYYLHREPGYKRFFNTILFFYLGYNITVFSGNLETLFVGWEILGISSFLLIGFYRDRYLPVKNAFKVFSIYRLGDVGLILAMWMSHHLFHENITFFQLQNDELVSHHLENHSIIGIFVALMILITAAAKSAQLPFSSWLPRAMEGPTPSSAIFYGSLSVHLGVFLMLRTFPLWEHQISVRIIIALLGITTSIVATGIARVQSSVKSQIAYSSISQIGLIFIELACGFEILALIHFAGNAFLRTYQLLVSPSTVSYLIREQFYNFVPAKETIEDSFSKKVKYTFYILCLKEFNLDSVMYQLWRPLKVMGRAINFVNAKNILYYFIPAYIIGLISLYYEASIPHEIHKFLPALFSFIGFIMVLKSYTERKNVHMAWMLIIMNHFWIALAISFNEHYKYTQSLLYLSGIVVMGTLGYFTIRKLKSVEEQVDLNQYNGHAYEHPKFAFVFLLACLGLTGFPITPTFIGEDVIFSHIHEDQFVLAFITASSLIIDGIAAIRIYSRVFLGPHIKSNHEKAYKSS